MAVAAKVNRKVREFTEEELESLPDNFQFIPGDILILKEMPCDRFIDHSFQHHSGYLIWDEAPCGQFFTWMDVWEGEEPWREDDGDPSGW